MNCFKKENQSDSGSRRTPHLNYLQYTIQDVALRSIVGSSCNMCGYGGDRSVVRNGCGCRRSGDGGGVTSTLVRDEGTHNNLLLEDGGVLWLNDVVEDIWWMFPPFSFSFTSLTQFATTLSVGTYMLYIKWWHMYEYIYFSTPLYDIIEIIW